MQPDRSKPPATPQMNHISQSDPPPTLFRPTLAAPQKTNSREVSQLLFAHKKTRCHQHLWPASPLKLGPRCASDRRSSKSRCHQERLSPEGPQHQRGWSGVHG